MKSVNVIRNPRKRSWLTQARIKEQLQLSLGRIVRLLSVNRFDVYNDTEGTRREVVFVIYDSQPGGVGADLGREVRWEVFEDGLLRAGGIVG